MINNDVVLPNLVARHAAEWPDRPFLTEIGGGSLTYGETQVEVRRWAAAWRSLGIGEGDRVLTLTPPLNGWFTAWMGMGQVGAADVGVNTEFHGLMLRYAVSGARARVLLTVPALLDRITPDIIAGTELDTLVVLGGESGTHASGLRMIGADDLLGDPIPEDEVRTVDLAETSVLVLTSGTTGPSKFVVLPWGAVFGGSQNLPPEELTPEDALYQMLPVYHGAARFMIAGITRAGGRCVFKSAMSVTDFWSDIAEHRCTVTFLPGPVVPWFLGQPEDPTDAETPLRMVFMVPIPSVGGEFAKRFGLRIRTGWGGSEVGLAVVGDYDPAKPTSCGRIRSDSYPGIEARIVDENGVDLPAGEPGEILVRARHPWGLFTEYFDAPEATATAMRDGWYHTGDAMRIDEDGDVYFVDRLKDTLRRRGKNISSFEVEAVVNSHAAVLESAAVGIPEPGGEDELKVVVVLRDGADLHPRDLVSFLTENLPHYMVPRFIELAADLPRTEATRRVRKVELRAAGVTATTWDREEEEPHRSRRSR